MNKNNVSSQMSIFDIAFFKFSFSIVVKKASIYLSSLLYFLLVLSCTTIVPLIAKVDPIQLFSISTTSMFLMMCASLVASFIAIEIFRTSIDDGTELLTVSKPISRKEIVFVKLFIFIIYIFFIALISTGLCSFSFLTGYGSINDNLTILLGVFSATIINGILFGSFATILSLYCKKIISLLITLSFTFILLVYSMLGSFVVESPTTLMQKNDETIIPYSLIGVDKNKKLKSLEGFSSLPSVDLTKSNDGKSSKPSDIWNKYKNQSSYDKFAMSDFGYQLSSIYTLGNINTSPVDALKRMSVFNSPITFEFSDFDINSLKDDVNYFSKINISFLNQILPNLNNEFDTFSLAMSKNSSAKIYNETFKKYNGKIFTSEYQLTKIDVDKDVNLEWDYIWNVKTYSVSTDFGSNNPKQETTIMTMKDYIDAYVNYVRQKKTTTSTIKPTDFNDLASLFIKEYFEEEIQRKEPNVILKELDSILYSAFYDLAFQGNKIRISSIWSIIDIFNDIDQNLTFKEIYRNYDDQNDIIYQDIITIPNSIPILGGQKTSIKKIIDKLLYGVSSSTTTNGDTKFSEVINKINSSQELKTKFENEAKKRNENRTILSLLGFKIDGYIDSSNSEISQLFSKSNETTNAFFNFSNKGTTFTFYENKNNTIQTYSNTVYRPSMSLIPTSIVPNFQKAKVMYVLNKDVVIIAWTMVAIVVFTLTMVLYSRRDFA